MWPFLVAGGLKFLSSSLKIMSDIRAGDAAREVANRDADLTLRAAGDALYRGQIATMRAAARGDAIIAEQRVENSTGGIDVNTGTNADLATQTMAFTDLDKEFIQNDAMREAWGLRSKAQIRRQEGEYQYAASRSQALGDLIGGIGDIAGMFGKKMADVPGRS